MECGGKRSATPLWIGNGTAGTAELRTCHAGGRGFTDGTDSEWDRDSQSGAAAVGLVTAVQREQSGREVEENYESREKREIGNFWRGKLRLARFADRDRTAEQPSYGPATRAGVVSRIPTSCRVGTDGGRRGG